MNKRLANPVPRITALHADVRKLILSARWQAAHAIYSTVAQVATLSHKAGSLAASELAALRDEDKLTPDLVFRDPYVLDFLGLKTSRRIRLHSMK